jgi:hypothetical protein
VEAFTKDGDFTLGGNLSVTAGPIGRDAEAKVGLQSVMFSYSRSQGLFGGLSVEGTVIATRKDDNAAYYGKPVEAKDILSGKVAAPAGARKLHQVLSKWWAIAGCFSGENGKKKEIVTGRLEQLQRSDFKNGAGEKPPYDSFPFSGRRRLPCDLAGYLRRAVDLTGYLFLHILAALGHFSRAFPGWDFEDHCHWPAGLSSITDATQWVNASSNLAEALFAATTPP